MLHTFVSVLGAVLIVAGLYSVLWGKYKEYKEKETETIPEAVKGTGAGETGKMKTVMEGVEEDNDIEMQKNQANKLPTPAVEAPKA